ncbi:4-hydroxythreonine-4-phosphate dehydrogenase PdxA [Desulfosporosinus shakirovi]|uniref:4-hydroxythreonine-4-phosphate dehydrogenase PdxA n=1 Tax=Desulfosporosinus shakirovi TaxID=2885154 RepID=UPI001E512706|nr:4-hydroxythreonine-4-phosphate dehydrogenase PdxA [Desulfosporosinus sp. SRJS8]MCB8815150.1 4-hydroxythreonine-4-phosphate dehydrogenase PdxA [Desulfosporosinus sp. SRJS8]
MTENYLHSKPMIGVTLGDAAGVGPEIVVKTAAKGVLQQYGQPIIVGDERVLKRGMEIAKVSFDYKVASGIEEAVKLSGLVLLDTGSIDAYSVQLGEVNSVCGKDSASNVGTCVEFCKQGLIEGICFGPNNKKAMKLAGFTLNGAIDLLSNFFEFKGYRGELNVLDHVFWTSRITSHIPIKDVSQNLTIEGILNSIDLVHKTLKRAGIDNPRIAVAALNPHGGEGGTCGLEEVEIINPAVEQLKQAGINAQGPFPADTLFIKLFKGEFDVAVTMFHDQGQIAMKLKGFDNGVTVMAGLPHPVTTCSHGTAFDVAGKGIANPGAWENAYILAAKMAGIDRINRRE